MARNIYPAQGILLKSKLTKHIRIPYVFKYTNAKTCWQMFKQWEVGVITKPIHFRWHTLQAAEKFSKKAKTEIKQVLYNESSNKNCMMFPYSKKQEKLLGVFITFTDITGNNLRFKTNYMTQT